MEDEFEIAEIVGRTKFEKWCNTKDWCRINRETKQQFNSSDLGVFSANTNGEVLHLITEVKNREKHYTSTYSDNTMIKEIKLNRLLAIKKKLMKIYPSIAESFKIAYAVIFPDDVIRVWIVDDIKEHKETVMLNIGKTEKGDKTKVPTPIYWLNKKEAIINEKLK